MSSDNIHNFEIWKNLVGLMVLISTISLIFIFNIPIHFTVFENPENKNLLIGIPIIIIIVIIVICMILLIILKIKKKRDKERDNAKK